MTIVIAPFNKQYTRVETSFFMRSLEGMCVCVCGNYRAEETRNLFFCICFIIIFFTSPHLSMFGAFGKAAETLFNVSLMFTH